MKKILIVIGILLCSSVAFAHSQEISGSGTYAMGDNDTPAQAQDKALLQAKRYAIEQAGVYVESYSQTANMQLTRDEINSISSGIMRITFQKVDRFIDTSSGIITFKATINTIIELDNVQEMRERIRQLTSKDQGKTHIGVDPISKTTSDGKTITYDPLQDSLRIFNPNDNTFLGDSSYLHVRQFLKNNHNPEIKTMLEFLGIDWRDLINEE